MLPFVGAQQMSDGREAVVEALQGLLEVDSRQYRAQVTASAAFELLHRHAEESGMCVLLKDDTGSYVPVIDSRAFRSFCIAAYMHSGKSVPSASASAHSTSNRAASSCANRAASSAASMRRMSATERPPWSLALLAAPALFSRSSMVLTRCHNCLCSSSKTSIRLFAMIVLEARSISPRDHSCSHCTWKDSSKMYESS